MKKIKKSKLVLAFMLLFCIMFQSITYANTTPVGEVEYLSFATDEEADKYLT